MSSINSIRVKAEIPHKNIVRIAGIMFLLNLMIPLLNWIFLLSKYRVPEDVVGTANKIMANELLFRLGITFELFLSVGLIILALVLYSILKPVNKDLAFLALLLKIVEATLMAVIVLVTFIALLALNGEALQNVFTIEQLLYPIGIIFNAHTALASIPMVFLGLDMMIFSYLFFKSKYIPRILAGFGILAFALILVHALMFILFPEYAMLPISQIIFWAPSGIFEIIIGLWLLIKGIKIS